MSGTGKECHDLSKAEVGQWVKVGRSTFGVDRVAEVVKVWKNGIFVVIDQDCEVKFVPRSRTQATERGGSNWGNCLVAWVFKPEETVESFLAAVDEKEQEVSNLEAARLAKREAVIARRIEQAKITHQRSTDVPDLYFARWTDQAGAPRLAIYAPRYRPLDELNDTDVAAPLYEVILSDYQSGKYFNGHQGESRISHEDAVNRWIANGL